MIVTKITSHSKEIQQLWGWSVSSGPKAAGTITFFLFGPQSHWQMKVETKCFKFDCYVVTIRQRSSTTEKFLFLKHILLEFLKIQYATVIFKNDSLKKGRELTRNCKIFCQSLKGKPSKIYQLLLQDTFVLAPKLMVYLWKWWKLPNLNWFCLCKNFIFLWCGETLVT